MLVGENGYFVGEKRDGMGTDMEQRQDGTGPAKVMPQWMAKYPCPSCGAGYGQCHEFAASGFQCCKDCRHPGHTLAQPNPWTADELVEMWAGREMPEYIAGVVAKLRG